MCYFIQYFVGVSVFSICYGEWNFTYYLERHYLVTYEVLFLTNVSRKDHTVDTCNPQLAGRPVYSPSSRKRINSSHAPPGEGLA